LAVAEALAPSLGITRVTDITRLDRLGLPVYASVRPRSNGLRVTAGKGVTCDEARASAVMEAIEHAVAEPQRSAWHSRRRSLADIAAQFEDGVCIADFVPTAGLTLTSATMVTTVTCERVGDRGGAQLPAEIVFFPYCDPHARQRRFASTSTNGLASGNSVEEATLHGLLEVLERDSLAMNRPCDASQWVEHDDLPDPARNFGENWRRLGIELAVRYIPNAFGLPCFQAVLSEGTSNDVNLAAGSGLHVNRDVALLRAICEAAQSRLSTIHGGRDDITHFYSKYTRRSPDERMRAERLVVSAIFDKTRAIRFASIPHWPKDGRLIPSILEDVLAKVRQAGFSSVFRYRFRVPLNGLQVVRVIVPKAEIVDGHTRRIGRRLLGRIVAHA